MPSSSVSGRLPIQFRNAVFAADVRVPEASGIPVLGNPEFLYQSESLVVPTKLSTAQLPLPRSVTFKEMWDRSKARMSRVVARWGGRALRAVWFLLTFAIFYVWALSALFPIFEWFGWPHLRAHLKSLSDFLGRPDWRETFLAMTLAGILTFLATITLTTHLDKVFNWIFRLCPRNWQPWLAILLDKVVDEWDRRLGTIDTLRKRISWSLVRLSLWTTYMVLAFASLQIMASLMLGDQPSDTFRITYTLLAQALLNVPFVAFLFIQLFGLINRLDPVADGILNSSVLGVFQVAMALIVFKGLYRVRVFTVEASPYTFFRRLRHKRTRPSTNS